MNFFFLLQIDFFQMNPAVHLHNYIVSRHRFLAGTACLCHFTIHLLHHCHLQAELGENDRGGTLSRTSEFGLSDINCIFLKLFVACKNI